MVLPWCGRYLCLPAQIFETTSLWWDPDTFPLCPSSMFQLHWREGGCAVKERYEALVADCCCWDGGFCAVIWQLSRVGIGSAELSFLSRSVCHREPSLLVLCCCRLPTSRRSPSSDRILTYKEQLQALEKSSYFGPRNTEFLISGALPIRKCIWWRFRYWSWLRKMGRSNQMAGICFLLSFWMA